MKYYRQYGRGKRKIYILHNEVLIVMVFYILLETGFTKDKHTGNDKVSNLKFIAVRKMSLRKEKHRQSLFVVSIVFSLSSRISRTKSNTIV